MTGITVIIPSVGRVSLAATLRSIADQTDHEDTVIVVEDSEFDKGSAGLVRLFTHNQDTRGKWGSLNVGAKAPLGAFGHGARNWLLDNWFDRKEDARYCYSIDDDDIMLPGALRAMREAIDAHPGCWFLFKMIGGEGSHYPGMTVPVPGLEGVLRRGNVGTPMILAPNCAARWGTSHSYGGPYDKINLGDGYFGDGQYAEALAEELGPPVWIDQTVACVRP